MERGRLSLIIRPRGIAAIWSRWKQKWANHQAQANELQKLMKQVESLQKEMARTTAVLIKQVLRVWWSEESGTVVSEDERLKQEDLHWYRALAEEFAAITYVNFLASVLLRIRNLVICAGVLYALIVISVSVYPFRAALHNSNDDGHFADRDGTCSWVCLCGDASRSHSEQAHFYERR